VSTPITPNELARCFPGASKSCLAANSAVSHPEQRQRPQELVRCDEGKAQSTRCVPVCFTLYRLRLLDVDAKYASVKDLLDCLVSAGFVAGDKEGQVSLEVRQEKVKTKAEEKTLIELIPL
jgi:hypothetical protein